MDAGLKAYAIARFENLDTDTKQQFVKTLKLYPEKVLEFISTSLHNWGIWATVESMRAVSTNLNEDPQTILEALREHFKADLEAVQV